MISLNLAPRHRVVRPAADMSDAFVLESLRSKQLTPPIGSMTFCYDGTEQSLRLQAVTLVMSNANICYSGWDILEKDATYFTQHAVAADRSATERSASSRERRSLRRNQTAASHDYPAVAPAHNRIDRPHPRYSVSARHLPNAIGSFQDSLVINYITDRPALYCGWPRLWHRYGPRRGLPRLRARLLHHRRD